MKRFGCKELALSEIFELKISDQHFLYELVQFYSGGCSILLEHKEASVEERERKTLSSELGGADICWC